MFAYCGSFRYFIVIHESPVGKSDRTKTATLVVSDVVTSQREALDIVGSQTDQVSYGGSTPDLDVSSIANKEERLTLLDIYFTS